MYKKTNSFLKLEDLYALDCINKYGLVNTKHIPQIKEIKFEFSLNELLKLNIYDFNRDVKEISLKTKILIIFFLFFGILPNIKNKIVETEKNNKSIIGNRNNLFLHFTIHDKTVLHQFLFILFVEKRHYYSKLNSIFFISKNILKIYSNFLTSLICLDDVCFLMSDFLMFSHFRELSFEFSCLFESQKTNKYTNKSFSGIELLI
jgi:hypothetical protein